MGARSRSSCGPGRAPRFRPGAPSGSPSKLTFPLLLECDTIDSANNCSEERLSSQVLREQGSAVDSFIRLVRGHASVTRALNAGLVADHGLTINQYEALLHLARAEGRRMRRVDLAARLVLTASGVTRMLDGLEQAGYVD